MPKRLPQQDCPRCGNQFPGGLKRCTACGLDVTKVHLTPDAASPWPGFERGVIECDSCGYATPDLQARRGRIQKCGQCSKVLYIPSGLYSLPQGLTQGKSGYVRSDAFWWKAKDWLDAKLSRLTRSRYRYAIIFLVLVVSLGLLFGIQQLKLQGQKVELPPSPLQIYYTNVLNVDQTLRQDEDQYELGAGGPPSVEQYNDRITPANSTRFVRNTERVLNQVQDLLSQVYNMAPSVPAGAEAHYNQLRTKLEERQRYYARLKDGVEKKDQPRWKEAFANIPSLKQAESQEEQALSQLQNLLLRQQQSLVTPKA